MAQGLFKSYGGVRALDRVGVRLRGGEVDVLVGRLVEVAEVGQGGVAQLSYGRGGLSEDEEAEADAVAAVEGAFHQAEADRFADQPVCGRTVRQGPMVVPRAAG